MIVYLQLCQGKGGGGEGDGGSRLPIAFHIWYPSTLLSPPSMLIGDPGTDSRALAGLTPRLSIKSIMALSETSVRI